MWSPRTRHPQSPALRFLREALVEPLDPAPALRWRERLAAGGVVAEIAREESFRRALPLVARAVAAAGFEDALPAAERGLLHAARLAGEARAKAVERTLVPLGAACATVGVSPVLLKGVALHGALYPDPALRPVSDVDVLVLPDALPAARRALAAAGFAPDAVTAARLLALDASRGRESFLSDFVFRRAGGLPLEVKLDPLQLGVPMSSAAAFETGARPSPRWPGFRVLAPGPMAVQQALHLARHDGSDLLWFAELAWGLRTAAARGDLGAEACAAAAALVARDGLLGPLRETLREAARLFPGSVPAALSEAVAPGGPTPPRLRGRPGRPSAPDEAAATLSLQAFHAVAARRPGVVLDTLRRRLFPHPAYLAARAGLSPQERAGWRHRLARWAGFLRLRS